MKRLVLAVIALVALAGSGPVAVAQEYKGPKLSVDQLTYHFGKVVQGEQAEHIFEIHSVGTESLVIDRVQSSCGCAAAVISSNRLEPGSVGQIKVTVDTTGRKGHLDKYVTVYTNDRIMPAVTLTVSLDVIQK